MTSSALTRISDGRTAVSVAWTSSPLTAKPALVSSCASTPANAGLRPTWFSHSLLWDSWIDIDVPSSSVVRASSGATWRS